MTKKAKPLLTITALLCVCLMAQAQTQIGLQLGSNFSKMNFEYVDHRFFAMPDGSTFIKPGLNFAVLFNFHLSKSFSIQVEPGFSGLGTKYNENSRNAADAWAYEGEGTISLSYLNLPVIMQFKQKTGRIETIFSLGPEVRLLARPMKLERSYAFEWGGGSEEGKQKITGGEHRIARLDYGVVAGLGVQIPVQRVKVFNDIRYHYGVANIKFKSQYNETIKSHNIYGSVNFGVLIPFVR